MKTLIPIVIALVSAGCLEDKKPHLDCSGGGDAFAYRGTDYCIYESAIIIEGFDCPAAVPFEQQSGDLTICSPTDQPPADGWPALVTSWEQSGHEPRGDIGDTSALDVIEVDTSVPDTTPSDTTPSGICVTGLATGQCWDASQCPDGWGCAGSSSCGACNGCASGGQPGNCAPLSGADSLGLIGWPGATASDVTLYAFFWIQDPAYALLECPAFALELGAGDGSFTLGQNEGNCSGPVVPPAATVIVRQAPLPAVRTDAGVRVHGRFRTGCGSGDPASCSGSVDLISNVVVLPP